MIKSDFGHRTNLSPILYLLNRKITIFLKEIAKEWNVLELAEKEYEKWLEGERKRLSRVDFLLRRFRKKCKSQEEWNDCKSEAMQSEDFKKCVRLSEAKALMKRHEAFESHMNDNEARLHQIAAIQRELAELGYEYANSLQSDADSLREKKKSLIKLAEIRKENIKVKKNVISESLFLLALKGLSSIFSHFFFIQTN